MNINVTHDKASSEFILAKTLIWRHTRRKSVQIIIIQSIVAIMLIAYDIFYFNTSGFSFRVGTKTASYNLHLTLGMGIAFFCGVLANLGNLEKSKNKFFSTVHATAKRHYSISDKQSIFLNDEFIKTDNEIAKCAYKWDVITSYIETESIILLLKNSSYDSLLLIDKSKLSEMERQDLITFLRNNKPETKNFHKPI